MSHQATIGKLILEAQGKLNELGVPYVFILDGVEKVFHNTTDLAADKMLMDKAYFRQQLTEKLIEARVEKIVDEEFWGNK